MLSLFIFFAVTPIAEPIATNEKSEPISLEYSLSKSPLTGEFHSATIGRLAVNMDRDEFYAQDLAVVEMQNLSQDGRQVAFVRVNVFDQDCDGELITGIEFRSQSYGLTVLPQFFSVGRASCIQIEYYHKDNNGGLHLGDRYRVKITE